MSGVSANAGLRNSNLNGVANHDPEDSLGTRDEYGDEPIEYSTEELAEASPRCTDAGNADVFVARHGAGFRFVLQWDTWIAWNGRRWEMVGAEGRAFQAVLLSAREDYALTKGVIAAIDEELRVARLKNEKDAVEAIEARRKYRCALLKWHEQSQNVSRIAATLKMLSSALVVAHTELDTHPWLLNCQNGTVDLRTGTLQDHDRGDFLTQIAPVDYDPEAACPAWLRFLSSSLAGNAAIVLYLQRLIGYAITGLTTEHLLLFFYGRGNNGKSTFFTTLLAALGDDYSCAAPPDLLVRPRGAAAPHPTEIASLYGKRMASCAELGEGQALDEPKVKRLTGGDPIRCRRMNEDWWTFAPNHTIFASGNDKLVVSGWDVGIWRRIKLIPWHIQIASDAVDRDLPSKLRAELVGILAWCVAGCLEWQRIGLAEPESVVSATALYRLDSDPLGRFISTALAVDPHGHITKAALRERYESWAKEAGHELMGGRRINERLRALGAAECTVRDGQRFRDGWRGIRAKTDAELYADSEPSSDNELS
jgi:putative DNA primase/helicase